MNRIKRYRSAKETNTGCLNACTLRDSVDFTHVTTVSSKMHFDFSQHCLFSEGQTSFHSNKLFKNSLFQKGYIQRLQDS